MLEAFPLSQVRLLAGPWLDAQEANRRYLLSLEPDRLLHTFRLNAGLPAPGRPLGGWEAPGVEVRGHFVGHYLSACARMVASTDDAALQERADLLVTELAKCQEALGGGYLSAFPESFWERLEALEKVPWAAYYTIHKIMAGLLDIHQLCGNAQALTVLEGMAGYFKGRMDRLPADQIDRIIAVEMGGMSEVLHNLYAVTGNPDHLALAHLYDRAAFLGPLALSHDNLSHLHANTHIPEVCGAARHYELTGDTRYRTAAEFFWHRVVGTRSYATGGSNRAEHWPRPGALAGTLSADNQESCTTYNMLKLTRYLHAWRGEAAQADYYERALWNGLLSVIDPVTGMVIYWLPLAAGHRKVFGTPTDSFWCCTGTGVESFSQLGLGIYWRDADTLYVDQFLASEVTWPERGLGLEQRTDFPAEPGTTLLLHTDQPIRLALRVRIPAWAGEGRAAHINGEPVPGPLTPGRYLTLDREWRDGDRIELCLPLTLHTEALPDDPEQVAVLFGPLVLAGLTEAPRAFLADPASAAWVEPVAGEPLTFRTTAPQAEGSEPLTLIPLYRVREEAYGVYWTVRAGEAVADAGGGEPTQPSATT